MFRPSIQLILLVCLAGAGWPSLVWSADGFEVAAGRVAITPVNGTFLAGYGRDRRSSGVYDDLFIKGAAIRSGGSYLVLLTVDCIGLTRPDIERIRREVKALHPDGNVVVSSTHTHAGPDVVGLWGPALWRSGRDEDYLEQLISQAVALAERLLGETRPARSVVASRDVALPWVENRSEPGLLDTRLSVLQFVGEDGQSLLTLTNFACHPTVLDGDNTLVSADYLAGFYPAMQAQLPGEHIFLQGAIGGWVQPIAGDSTYERVMAVGTSLAQASLAALDQAEPNPPAPIGFAERVVDVELVNWGFRLMMWLGVLDRSTFDGAMRTSVATFRLGEAVFVTHPGETSPAFSHASRALMGAEHGFVLGLTQDAMGYILKPEYFVEDAPYPHAEYLTSVSVGPSAGPQIMAALKDMLSMRGAQEGE